MSVAPFPAIRVTDQVDLHHCTATLGLRDMKNTHSLSSRVKLANQCRSYN